MPPAGPQPPSGAVVDASTAFVALNLLAIGTPARTVAGVCATSESSIQRIQRHAAQHSGAARVPHKGKGKRHDRRWHFGGALGQSNLARLDRLVGSMDASSTLDEIYAAYVATCPLPVPKPSTVAEALRKLEYTTKRLSAYGLRERVRKVGGRLLFLEPYDPQHMPIEVGFRAMKRRGAACRVVPCALASVLPSAGRSAPCPVPPSSTHRVWPCHSQVDAQEPRAHPRHAALPADPARGEVRHARGGTSGLRSVRVLKRLLAIVCDSCQCVPIRFKNI